jgi:hypothetical protein
MRCSLKGVLLALTAGAVLGAVVIPAIARARRERLDGACRANLDTLWRGAHTPNELGYDAIRRAMLVEMAEALAGLERR